MYKFRIFFADSLIPNKFSIVIFFLARLEIITEEILT